MTKYDDATVWAVAEALHNFSHSTPFSELDSSEHMEYFGMAEAALDAIDATILTSPVTSFSDRQVKPAARALWESLYDVPWAKATGTDLEEIIDIATRVLEASWVAASAAPGDVAAAATADDPEVERWTAGDGSSLPERLAKLEDGTKVTIRGDWGELHSMLALRDWGAELTVYFGSEATFWGMSRAEEYGITSAEWRRPLPAWARPNLPLVIALDTDILVLGDDGRYRRDLSRNVIPRTAVEMEQLAASIAAQVRVLIDGDGLHVKDTL